MVECGKAFARKDKLQRHMKQVHGRTLESVLNGQSGEQAELEKFAESNTHPVAKHASPSGRIPPVSFGDIPEVVGNIDNVYHSTSLE